MIGRAPPGWRRARVGVEARVRGEVAVAENLAQRIVHSRLVLDREQDGLAVAAGVIAIRRDGGVMQPGAPGRLAAVDVVQIGHVHPVGERMEQRHGHMPTALRCFAPDSACKTPWNAVMPAAMSHTERRPGPGRARCR